MTIPSPNQFKKETKVVRDETEVALVVPESRLGDGRLDEEDVKKVYSFGKTYKPVIIAIVLFVSGLVSGKGVDQAVDYIDTNDPIKTVNTRMDGLEEAQQRIEAKLDELLDKQPVMPVGPQEFSMNFDPVPVGDDSEVPFTVNQDTTTDDGSSRITAKTSFSVQSTDK